MNENANVMAGLMIALSQLQNLKGKIDDEVIDLLSLSGKEAIKSAHHFLDACEKALEMLDKNDEIPEDDPEEKIDNVVDLKAHES